MAKKKAYEPTREKFEKAKEKIKESLKKDIIKIKEREYLQQLRDAAKIDINGDILTAENPDTNQPVATVNGKSIVFKDVLTGLKLEDKIAQMKKSAIENRLKYLIDCEIVDQRALSMGYEKRANVQKNIKGAKKRVLYTLFIQDVLIPSIDIKEDVLKEYYEENKGDLRSPVFIKVEELRASTADEAEKIMEKLKQGADFSFLAEQTKRYRLEGKEWINLNKLPKRLRDSLEKAEAEGEIIGPVSWEEGFSIFLLKRREGGDIIPFEEAKQRVHEILWQDEYEKLLNKWEQTLREATTVVIYEKPLQVIRSYFEGNQPDTSKKLL